jgi:colicin import membrane protein
MRGPSIQKTIAASLLLHLALIALSVVLINYTKNVVLPSPYTVSLVNPGETGQSGRPASGSQAPELRTTGSPAAEREAPVKESKMIDTSSKNDQKRLDERMSELLAKKKIERIVKLRQVISVKSSGERATGEIPQKGGSPGGAKGTLFDSYYGKITDEIRGEWHYPDYMKKDLEAVVSVLIEKDGTLTGVKIEKSSGDRFFDRSALNAVAKASPVSRPPYEMEIGIRFYP